MNTADWIALGVIAACVLLYIVWPTKKPAPPARRNTTPPVPIGVGPATGAAYGAQAAAQPRRTYGAPKSARVVIHDDIDTDTTDLLTGIVIGAAVESLMDSPSIDTSDDTFTGGGGDFGGGGASGSWD